MVNPANAASIPPMKLRLSIWLTLALWREPRHPFPVRQRPRRLHDPILRGRGRGRGLRGEGQHVEGRAGPGDRLLSEERLEPISFQPAGNLLRAPAAIVVEVCGHETSRLRNDLLRCGAASL